MCMGKAEAKAETSSIKSQNHGAKKGLQNSSSPIPWANTEFIILKLSNTKVFHAILEKLQRRFYNFPKQFVVLGRV